MAHKKQFKNGTMIMGFSQKAFIFNKNRKFLIMRRTKTAPFGPLEWDLPGGDIEFGEDPIKSIIREVKEETGLTVKNPIPFDVYAGLDSENDYWVTVAFKAFKHKGKLAISWEHDLYKWVTIDEFLKLKITDRFRKYAKNLKKI
ncbi:MAG: ADP-ribose pyrophosphatase [Candidatus Nomurabacteria bacterium GW2011_GWF2_43_8]|uniref:ADP-ribose pyrophosphatase n=3 Tax=Candidatus Nomuraibacteriota TaxID=1752729 RepID=A0A0G1FQV0_9BACT|nr:MAG: ADP-ribose pyrophosphatase [Candidatus Nomurabacteria bacterium GW2011_GWB1_43_7]KKT24458.1 MAG: ADP-ribose pyrophosphatase [Candidatus Nomurabacteria bacterium GW2011_GWF2_43_8]